MAGFEQRDMSGSFFVNDRKQSANQPDRTGTAMVDGVMYRISGWIKPGRDGKKDWLSVSFTKMDDTGGGSAPARKPTTTGDGPDYFDSDVPF